MNAKTIKGALERFAGEILDLCESDAGEHRVRLERDSLSVTIIVGPATMRLDDDLTECERDIMAVARAAEKRMKGPEIRTALAVADKTHGASTISRALARLVHAGLLCNDHSKRGYSVESRKLGGTQ